MASETYETNRLVVIAKTNSRMQIAKTAYVASCAH